MGLRIPTPLQSTAKSLGLHNWSKKTGFPRDAYYGAIESIRSSLLAVGVDGSPDKIVAMLAVGLDEEDALTTHVLGLNTTVDISDADEWEKCCLAAAWVVVQAYFRDIDNGTWPES